MSAQKPSSVRTRPTFTRCLFMATEGSGIFDFERAGEDDAGEFGRPVEAGGDVGFESHAHDAARGGGVHEMHDALFVLDAKAGMGDVDALLGGADADDVASLKKAFGAFDFVHGKIFEGA